MNPNIQNRQIHGQNVVACVWDFDKTLIPGYMQKPLFEHFNVDENVFWSEVNQLPEKNIYMYLRLRHLIVLSGFSVCLVKLLL